MTIDTTEGSSITSEHNRWIKIIGNADPYLGKVTIGLHEVLQAHFLLAEYFSKTGEGLGGVGPKDINLSGLPSFLIPKRPRNISKALLPTYAS